MKFVGNLRKFFLVPKQENKKKLNIHQICESIRYS